MSLSDPNKVIAPFDRPTQQFLAAIDKTCRMESMRIADEMSALTLAGKDAIPDADDQGILALIQAYGILFNRCIHAGWIDDVYLTKYDQHRADEGMEVTDGDDSAGSSEHPKIIGGD